MKKLIILVVVLLTSCASTDSLFVKEQKRVIKKEYTHRAAVKCVTFGFIVIGVIIVEQKRE